MPKMSSSALATMLAAERYSAYGAETASKLTQERSDALDYYMGKMTDMIPPKGRSQAVSTDVADTVEGMMPMLMDIFCSGEDAVRFAPVGLEDEDAAKQETDYINHVFMQKNEGFLTLYSFIKDALLSKNGIVKIFWEKSEKKTRERLFDQSDDVFAIIMQRIQAEKSAELIEHTEHEDGYGETLHDFVVETTEEYGCARVMPVPPEEFLISARARSLTDTGYCAHIQIRTVGDLIDEGFDYDELKDLPTETWTRTTEEIKRNTIEEERRSADTTNKMSRLVAICEHYVRCDYDGDGTPVLLKVITGGTGDNTQIMSLDGEESIERVEDNPFAAMTPIIVTHRFWGRGAADIVMDVQRIKTSLLRSLLDNAYMANNQRVEVAETFASANTLDDLLANRPGGVVRTKNPGGVLPIPNSPIGNFVFPLIEYIDASREFRTGVSRQGAGLDANVLQNQTAQAVAQAMTAAQAKIKLIARIFAETGIKRMFMRLHAVVRQYGSKQETVKLRNKWVPIDPRAFRMRDDMTVEVGLGTGSKAEIINHLLMVLGLQKEGMMIGLAKPINLYNTAKRIIELLDLKSPEPYFVEPDPNAPAPPPPPDPKVQVAQMQAQIDQQKMQMQGQLDQAKAQRDTDLQATQAARQAETEARQAEADIAADRAKSAFDMQMEERKFELERELKILDHNLKVSQVQQQADLAAKTAGLKVTRGKKGDATTGTTSTADTVHTPQEAHHAALLDNMNQLIKHLAAPKHVIRDEAGRVVGVATAPNGHGGSG